MFRTFGKKPTVYSLETDVNGNPVNEYMLTSHVEKYLRLRKNTLLENFPALTKRFISYDERKKIEFESGCSDLCETLVLASEINKLLLGDKDFCKPHEQNICGLAQSNSNPNSHISIPNTSNIAHLKPVSQPTLINRNFNEGRSKEGRVFKLCIDDADPALVLKNANQIENLVPINLDMDIDGKKLKDTFLWNGNECCIKPQEFAEILCNDLDLNPLVFVPEIKSAIEQQLETASSTFVSSDKLLHGQSDQRVIIKLNIQIGNVSLNDQFEWDMSDEKNNPVEFAKNLCADLSLGSEFVPAIVHSIRGQLIWHRKMYAFSYNQLPKLETAFRNESERNMWSPLVEKLTDAEIEKRIKSEDRHTRRMRRLTSLRIQ